MPSWRRKRRVPFDVTISKETASDLDAAQSALGSGEVSLDDFMAAVKAAREKREREHGSEA